MKAAVPKHDIRAIDANQARQFWEQQDDARIFLRPDVLEPLCARVDWWLATWNGNPVCLWPICHAFDGSHRPPELSAYVGPLWHDEVGRQKAHRWWSITRTVQEAFLELFVVRYSSFEFELPPGTRDIRVFLWFRERSAQKLAINIEPRHTALLGLPTQTEAKDILSGFSRNRVKDVHRFRRAGNFVDWPNPDVSSLHAIYAGLLEKKSVGDKARRRRNEVEALVLLAESGYGSVLSFQDERGVPSGFVLALESRRTAFLVLAAVSDTARGRGLPAIMNYEVILRALDAGISTVDFLGANSPLGAEEKHRYGALPSLYFRIAVSSE